MRFLDVWVNRYPLVICYIAIENTLIIVSFPITHEILTGLRKSISGARALHVAAAKGLARPSLQRGRGFNGAGGIWPGQQGKQQAFYDLF